MTDAETNDLLLAKLTENGFLPGVFGAHQPPIDTLRLALIEAVTYEDLGYLLSDMTADASYAVAIEQHSGWPCIRDANEGRAIVGAQPFVLVMQSAAPPSRQHKPITMSYEGKEPPAKSFRTRADVLAERAAAQPVAEEDQPAEE